jgi:hypothetical protein
MGDVIDFKPKRNLQVDVELEGVDEQLLLECAIVEMWERLDGYTLLNEDKFVYHVWFLQFSDLCFQAMEDKRFNVSEDGEIAIDSNLLEAFKESIEGFKKESATNDNRTE